VLDLNCRAHEVHNLYVVDSSFFPSHASVSPGLTVIANALRVGDRLIEQIIISTTCKLCLTAKVSGGRYD
jgi:choline dehydrogenase-like flavoprotein